MGGEQGRIQEAVNYAALLRVAEGSEKRVDAWIRRIGEAEFATRPITEFREAFDVDPSRLALAYSQAQRAIESLPREVEIAVKTDGVYPRLLRAVDGAPRVLFLRGLVELANQTVVSIVGTRQPTPEGRQRARKLAAMLVDRGIVVASGLARGIDEAAHRGALEAGGGTIAVLGTPIDRVYPKEHRELQERIGCEGLLVSQFPPSEPIRRFNFPKRNAVMSGLSVATVVIEASETSGALIQAQQCLKQGRRLFIPRSAVTNPALRWPRRFLARPNASEFSTVDDLMRELEGYLEEHGWFRRTPGGVREASSTLVCLGDVR